MTARMDNLASSEDDALLRQLADDQIEHLVKQPYGRAETGSTVTEDASAPEQWESDLLVYDDQEHTQGQPGEAGADKAFILKSPSDTHAVAAVDQEELLAPAVPSEISSKVAELIAQLQVEKAAEKARQEAQAKQNETLAEAVSGELLDAEDIDPANVRPAGREMPLEDIEATFAPQVSQSEPTSTSVNLAEEILSQRMAAEDVIGEEVLACEENLNGQPTDPAQTAPVELTQSNETENTPAGVADERPESGRTKNFMITLAIIALTTTVIMFGYKLFF